MELSWPYVHLLINPFPIILAVMGVVAVIVALITRYHGIWQYGVASLFFMGLTAVPTMLTGDEAGETMRGAWYVAREAIHRHEEAGDWAMWVMVVTGLVALYAWWRSLPRNNERRALPPRWLQIAVLVTALFSVAAVTRASLLGGDVMHDSSILAGPRPAGVPAQPPAQDEDR